MVSAVGEDDYSSLGVGPEYLRGVVEYLNMVPESKYSLLLSEKNGRVKGSLRRRDKDIDLSKIAEKFGGGGHPGASGFVLEGGIESSSGYKIVLDNLSKKTLDF